MKNVINMNFQKRHLGMQELVFINKLKPNYADLPEKKFEN